MKWEVQYSSRAGNITLTLNNYKIEITIPPEIAVGAVVSLFEGLKKADDRIKGYELHVYNLERELEELQEIQLQKEIERETECNTSPEK